MQAAESKAIADDAQADLDKALPALESALNSLKLLTRNDVVEVKALKNPPAGRGLHSSTSQLKLSRV